MNLDDLERDALARGLARWYRGRLIPIMKGADDGDDGGGDKGGSGDGGDGPRTFTEDQVNKIVQDRVARVKNTPPDDYEDLKAKAAKLDEIEAADKTELEKEREVREKAESDAKTATERAQARLVNAEIIAASAGKFADPSDATSLIDRSEIKFDTDGNPTNVAELVTSLLEAKPHLAVAKGGSRGDADQGAREGGAANQLPRDALKNMSHAEILQAQKEGRLDAVLGRAR